jgi:hypothetical protein
MVAKEILEPMASVEAEVELVFPTEMLAVAVW